jgi:hypothetical protein
MDARWSWVSAARVSRIELRRSSALTAGAAVAVLGVAGVWLPATTGQADLWDVQWAALAVYQRILLAVLWPLALGAGAWLALRDRRSHTDELFGTTARPVRQRLLPTAAALAIWLVVAYLVIFAAGAVRVAGHAVWLDAGWLAIVGVGALALVAAGWIGLAVGRLVRSNFTPPALVLLGAVALIAASTPPPESPIPGAALLPQLEPVDEFHTVAGAVTLGQAVWFAALAVTGLLVCTSVHRWTRVAAVLPVVVGVAVAVPLVDTATYVRDPAALAEVCSHDVCVTKAHERLLPSFVGPARTALALLAKLPDPPTSVHEVTDDVRGSQPADTVWFDSANLRPGGTWSGTADELVVRILAGAGTRPCHGYDDYRARAVAADWLYGSVDAPGPQLTTAERSARRALWNALRSLPPAGQVARIAALRTAARTCHGNLLSILTGGVS